MKITKRILSTLLAVTLLLSTFAMLFQKQEKNVVIKYTKQHETDRFKCLDGMYGIDFLYPGDERGHRILPFGGLPPAGIVL